MDVVSLLGVSPTQQPCEQGSSQSCPARNNKTNTRAVIRMLSLPDNSAQSLLFSTNAVASLNQQKVA